LINSHRSIPSLFVTNLRQEDLSCLPQETRNCGDRRRLSILHYDALTYLQHFSEQTSPADVYKEIKCTLK